MVPILIGAAVVIVVQLWAIDYQRRVIRDLQRQLETTRANRIDFELALRSFNQQEDYCRTEGHVWASAVGEPTYCVVCNAIVS